MDKMVRKKIFNTFLAIFILCACFAIGCSCNGGKNLPEVPQEQSKAMQLSVGSKTIIIGESFTLSVTGVGEKTAVFYSSSNESVATVSNQGLITGVSQGDSTITVTAGEQIKYCYVTVVKDTRVAVLRVYNVEQTPDGNFVPLGFNEDYPLDVRVIFDGGVVQGNFTFESSDETVATVTSQGVIQTKNKNGKAVIKITADYQGRFGNILAAEVVVSVNDAKWQVGLNSEETIYALANYNGTSYKNTETFYATLKIGDKTVSLSDMQAEAGNDNITVSGNVLTAKKAGSSFVKLSYTDTVDSISYERYIPLEISYIEVDKTDGAVNVITKKENATFAAFNTIVGFTDNSSVTAASDVTGNVEVPITVENGEFKNLGAGIREIVVYTDSLKVKSTVYVADYSLVGNTIDGCLGYFGVLNNTENPKKEDFQTIVLPERIGAVKNFTLWNGKVEQKYLLNKFWSTEYNDETKAVTVSTSTIQSNVEYLGRLICTIESNDATYVGSVFASHYVLRESEHLAWLNNSDYSESNFTYVLANDIVGGTIENTNASWKYGARLYGMGHVLSDITVKGKGMFGGVYNAGGFIKDIAIKVSNVSLENGYMGLITNEFQNVTLENVYIEANCAEVINCSYGTNSTDIFKNVIVNCAGKSLYASSYYDTARGFAAIPETNVITADGSFFDAYSQGLPVGFENSGFEIGSDGLYYFGNKIMIKKSLQTLTDSSSMVGDLGYIYVNGEKNTIVLPEKVGYVNGLNLKFGANNNPVGSNYSYDDETKTITFNNIGDWAWYTGEQTLSFEGETANYTAKMYIVTKAITTAEELQSAIASHSGSYLLLNDISDVAFNDTTSVWTSAIKLYGRGHSLKNVTVNGKGMFGGVVNGLVLKDVAIKVTAVSLESGYVGLIGNEMQNSTFENVYLETSHKLNNASYTSSKYKNVILNCGGNTFNKADSDTETNVISVNDSFFDAYSQGLPAGFENSGFEIKADGLYFGTNLLLAK